MQVYRMYCATWLQRTTIHLREMYDFFRGKYTVLSLDKKTLEKHRATLAIDSVDLSEKNDFEVLTLTSGPFTFSAAEDGIYMLSTDDTSSVPGARSALETYYRDRMGPALSYLYSRGAPLPKRLTDVAELYPHVLVVKQATEDDVIALYQELGESYDHKVSSLTTQIFFGEIFTVIRSIKKDVRRDDVIDDLVANIIFFQEFSKQLRGYLNQHRSTWDTISSIRESRDLRYKDLPRIRETILGYLKMLLFINARLKQMGDITQSRYALLRPEVKAELEECNLLRFENVLADLRYLKDIWDMTIEYAKETLQLIESLYQENTQRELNALKFITILTLLTGFFGMNIAFPWDDEWPDIFTSSVAVVISVGLAGLLAFYLIRWTIYFRRFTLKKRK